jgi:N-acetyl-anhydromuramyl-L-alanine amidase AmpD
VGIEICAAGMLKVDRSWFGSLVPADEIRVIKGNQGQIPIPGNYHKFTREQEESLVQLLLYLKNEAPDIFSFDRVIGHDEAMQSVGKYGNKNDPGGALSMTMPQLRANLYKEYAKNES